MDRPMDSSQLVAASGFGLSERGHGHSHTGHAPHGKSGRKGSLAHS